MSYSSGDAGEEEFVVGVEVRTVRFSTASRLRTFVRGGITGLRRCFSNVVSTRIDLGIMGPRSTGGGRTTVQLVVGGKSYFTRGMGSAFRRSVSRYMRTLRGRLIGFGRGVETGWGGNEWV